MSMSNEPRKIAETNSEINPSSNFIVWPEWSDIKINEEKWSDAKDDSQYYEDPHPPVLPASFSPHTWKRPHDIKNIKFVVYTLSSINAPDLFINNKHLQCKFIRWFISSLNILYYYGKDGLDINDSNYSWRLKGKPWKGWYYIYSINNMKRKSQHNPLINPYGKYIVRLFFLGSWRAITIDDLIPFDKEDNPLLPRTENPEELWPMFLAKAMLKLTSLNWHSSLKEAIHEEIIDPKFVDLNPIYLLTGWTCLYLDISQLYPQDRWKLLLKYVKNYKQLYTVNPSNALNVSNEDNVNERSVKTSKISVTKGKDNDKRMVMKSRKNTSNTESSKSLVQLKSIQSSKNEESKSKSKDVDIVTVLLLKDTKSNGAEDDTLLNYPIYVELISDVPGVGPTEPTQRILLFNHNHNVLNNDQNSDKRKAIWFDFNELSKYHMKIFFFYKSNHFKYSIDVSDTFNDYQHNNNNEKSFKQYYQYFHQPNMKNFTNEPLFLLIDTAHPEFLLFNFNVIPNPKQSSTLLIERHCWFKRIYNNNPLLKIKTSTSSSKILYFDRGKHLCRLFIQSSSSYHLSVHSNTSFNIGNRQEVHHLMTSEPQLLEKFSENIKNSLIHAFDAFGGENYTECIRNYYKSYMPHQRSRQINKKNCKFIHKSFMNALIDFIEEKCVKNDLKDILQALQVFFIDPDIGRNNLHALKRSSNIQQQILTSNPSVESIYKKMAEEENKLNNLNNSNLNENNHNLCKIKAAVTIQACWRMFRVQSYQKIHKSSPQDSKKNEIIKSLQLITEIIQKNAFFGHIKSFTQNNICSYPFSKDIYVLNLTKISGKCSFAANWIPLFRLNVNVAENCIVFGAFNLFSNILCPYCRVFNNDSGKEIHRIINNVLPHRYTRNKNGYTIFGYGWAYFEDYNKLRQLDKFGWTLHIITMKESPEFNFILPGSCQGSEGFEKEIPISSLIEIPKLYMNKLLNNYIPNILNKIFKAVIKPLKSSFVTLRVGLSYKNVEMKVQIADSHGRIFAEATGRSEIIFPVIFFNKSDLEKDWLYVEAWVMKQSWPLTKKEWATVLAIKKSRQYNFKLDEKDENEIVVLNEFDDVLFSVKSGSRLNFGRMGIKEDEKEEEDSEVILKDPHWILQVVSDVEDACELFEDFSREEEIKKMKESWIANDPDRFERGRAKRDAFLDLLESDGVVKMTDIEDEQDEQDNTNKEIRTLKSPYDVF